MTSPTPTSKKKKETKPVPTESETTATATPPTPAPAAAAPAAGSTPRIRLDEANAKLSYANFFNVSSTREETALMFGMIQVSANPGQEIVIQVSDRVVISPHAAKRLHAMLGQVLSQYESRFGQLSDDTQSR